MGVSDWMDRSIKVYHTYAMDSDKTESIAYEPRGKYERCDECLCRPCECTRF